MRLDVAAVEVAAAWHRQQLMVPIRNASCTVLCVSQLLLLLLLLLQLLRL